MRLLITGATGLLGQYVVTEALRRGHFVRALTRSGGASIPLFSSDPSRLEIVCADLRSPRDLPPIVNDIDSVLHLAATKTGDFHTQFAGTVTATENLLAAMDEADVTRIVAASSLAVYDYRRIRRLSLVDEDSPLEARPQDRDDYCQTKLLQERLIRSHAEEHGWTWTILRPGMIYGPNNLWNARLGLPLGSRWWLRIGASAQVPLTYVENCADAVVTAAEHPAAGGCVFNVVDDHPPTQRRLVKVVKRRAAPTVRILPIPYILVCGMARLAQCLNFLLFAGRAKMPGILVPARLQARCKPVRYSNRRLREILGWRPRYGLLESLDRCLSPPHADAPSEELLPALGDAHPSMR